MRAEAGHANVERSISATTSGVDDSDDAATKGARRTIGVSSFYCFLALDVLKASIKAHARLIASEIERRRLEREGERKRLRVNDRNFFDFSFFFITLLFLFSLTSS